MKKGSPINGLRRIIPSLKGEVLRLPKTKMERGPSLSSSGSGTPTLPNDEEVTLIIFSRLFFGHEVHRTVQLFS